MKLNMLTMLTLILLVTSLSCSGDRPTGPSSKPVTSESEPPYHGTVWIDPDIIKDTDPTAFQSISYQGREQREMFDRRVDGWITIRPRLFNVQFEDGLSTEIQVNPEFGGKTYCEKVATKYGKAIGRLPTILRTKVETVWIHKGNYPLGGGNDNILIHTELTEGNNSPFLEEMLIHEGVHTSLEGLYTKGDNTYWEEAKKHWEEAQKDDPGFISVYAKDFPQSEDVAESFLSYFALRYRSARISEKYEETVLNTMPNRIAFFDSLLIKNMHPITEDLRFECVQ